MLDRAKKKQKLANMSGLIDVRRNYLSVSVRPRHRITLDLYFLEIHRAGKERFAATGAALALSNERGFKVFGLNAQPPKVIRAALEATYRAPLAHLAGLAEQMIGQLDDRLAAAGFGVPPREMVIPLGSPWSIPPFPGLEIGGTGAGIATFQLRPEGLRFYSPPQPRPKAGPGQPLHPSSARARSLWEATWSPEPVGRLWALISREVETDLRSLSAEALRILPTSVVY